MNKQGVLLLKLLLGKKLQLLREMDCYCAQKLASAHSFLVSGPGLVSSESVIQGSAMHPGDNMERSLCPEPCSLMKLFSEADAVLECLVCVERVPPRVVMREMCCSSS